MPRPLHAHVPLALACAAAIGVAGCGASHDTRRERLQSSVVDAANAALDDEGSYSNAVAARCDGAGPRVRCEVGLTNGGAAYEDRYGLVVGTDGCWRAVRHGIDQAASARSADTPPPRVIRGCAS
jgi:hypothetical protein